MRSYKLRTAIFANYGHWGDLKNYPPKDPEYVAPKGGDRKGNSSRGRGWVDNKGRVWVPNDNDKKHRPHWDVQPPKGPGYENVYPKPEYYPDDEAPDNNYVSPGNHPVVSPVAAGITLGGVVTIIIEYGWILAL